MLFSVLLFLLLGVGAVPSARWESDPSDNLPSGFVTTKGSQFWLDHYPYYFNGANAYWLPQMVHDEQFEQVYQELQTIGVKVIRTWAFSMLDDALPTTNLTYYQLVGAHLADVAYPSLNYGPSGLQRLDKTVAYAEKYDMKLILTLTNNWDDYGGMDMYNEQTINTTYHSDFYTYQPMIDLYEDYAKQIVTRYRNSSAIFAWELANEPRANGYPTVTVPNFTVADLTKWVADRSAYIKTLDPCHMVAIGDEGYYNWPNNTDYIYNGTSGLDFDANLQIDTIDFGTFHLYPQSWSELPIKEWGTNYIKQHIDSMNNIGKPVVIEEFGVTGYDNQTSIYPEWFQTAEDGGLGGIMLWSLGPAGLDLHDTTVVVSGLNGVGDDVIDNFDVYPNKTEIWDLWGKAGDIMNAKSGPNAQ